MSKEPLVSIIIVNYNGKQYLGECLESLEDTNYKNHEVILVDNGSKDGSVEFVKHNFQYVKIVTLPANYGFCKPNNIGAKIAGGKYLVFLNNDTKATATWLEELVAVLEGDNELAIAQSLLLRPNGEIDSSGDFVTSYGLAYSSKKGNFTEVRNILSARGACMIVRRDLFFKLGGFDEDYFLSFEDVEIGWKAWIMGYKVVMVPRSIVYHLGGGTLEEVRPIINYHGAKNMVSLIMTNFETHIAVKNILLLFLVFIAHIFTGKSAKKGISRKSLLRAGLWVLRNLRHIWSKHKEVNSKRVRSTRMLKEMQLITSRSES